MTPMGKGEITPQAGVAQQRLADGMNSGLTHPMKVTSHQTRKDNTIEPTESHKVLPWPGMP